MKKGGVYNTKAQITVFVIIGILLIASIGLVFYFSSASKKTDDINIKTFSASEITSQIEKQRDKCLNDNTIMAIDAYGFDSLKIESLISQSISICIQPVINKYKGVAEITSSPLTLKVNIDKDNVKIEGNYLISVKKGDTQTLDSFSLTLPRTISTNIQADDSCSIISNVYLKSWDDKFEIFVPAGTKAKYKDGKCLDKINIALYDPTIDYGGRETSFTTLAYVPGPLGAEFSQGVDLKLKYNISTDYTPYYDAANIKEHFYIMPESGMAIQYYDKENQNYYIYPNSGNLKNLADTQTKIIEAKVDFFQDGKVHHTSNCEISKSIVVESDDKRTYISLTQGRYVKQSSGSCLEEAKIVRGPRTSRVVNFGYFDYDFSPAGAKFIPFAKISYRYTDQEAERPEFLYGSYNWQDLITGTWQDPTGNQPPTIIISTEIINENQVIFPFNISDDSDINFTCSLYINDAKEGETMDSAITGANNFTRTLDGGSYEWFIQCKDRYLWANSTKRSICVGESCSIPSYAFFLPLKNIFYIVDGFSTKITGFFTLESGSENGYSPRNEWDLKIAWDDGGIYRPVFTKVDPENNLISGFVEHFSQIIPAQGCEDNQYAYFPEVLTIANAEVCPIGQSATKNFDYTVIPAQSCSGENGIQIDNTRSGSDEATNTPGVASAGPQVSTLTLIEQDGTPDRTYCSWMDLYMHVYGIGIESTFPGIKITEEEYNDKILTPEKLLEGWEESKCNDVPEEKQEACMVCVGFAKECITKGCDGRLNKQGDTMGSLEFCTETMYGEQCTWQEGECASMTGDTPCKQEACNKCMEWCNTMPEGFGGSGTTTGSLEHCADVIEHEAEACAPELKVTITSPANGGTYKNVTVNISATTTNFEAAKWEYSLNGAALTEFTLGQIITAIEGLNTLIVKAADSEGYGAEATSKFTVNTNNEPPVIALISPVNGAIYNSTSVLLNATSNQAIASATVNLINANGDNNRELTSIELSQGWAILNCTQGENKFKLYAKNADGQIGSVTATFIVNTSAQGLIPPIINIILPLHGGDYEVSIPLNKTLLNVSSDQRITSWKYSLNGEENKTLTSTSSQITVKNGVNNIVVYGTNANGTGYNSADFTVLLVNTAYLPIITINQPSHGVTYSSKFIIIKSIANQVINSWKYSLNGGEKKDCNCGSEDYIEALEGRNNLTIYGKSANGTGQISTFFFVNITSA